MKIIFEIYKKKIIKLKIIFYFKKQIISIFQNGSITERNRY